jgi:transcriptional regulator with XRE-family HTH domain
VALFFDAEWFDARLAQAGLSRGDVAAALGLADTQIAELWKDQRELSAADVRVLAGLLGAGAAEIASRAGISTPVPRDESVEARLARIEAALAEIKALLLER